MNKILVRKIIAAVAAAALSLSYAPQVLAANADIAEVECVSQQAASAEITAEQSSALPSSYDLRDYGRITPVSDQGKYGLCWTFSTLGSAESQLVAQFPDISFSNFHLAWFAMHGDEEYEFGWPWYAFSGADSFDVSGNEAIAVGALAAWKGPVYSETMPYGYEYADETLRWYADYHLQDAYFMPEDENVTAYKVDQPRADTDTIKTLLMENGAVSVSIAYYTAKFYNEETCAYYCNKNYNANHSVLIAGWDDNYPKENFKAGCRPTKDGAWLIRNSYGVEFGDTGYFWLSYEDKSFIPEPVLCLEPNDNYANNYQYDICGWGRSIAADEFTDPAKASKIGYMANIFTAEGKEQLEAVSFYTTDANTKYEISVYTGVKAGAPTSGKLVYSGHTGTEPYAGYHTIEMTKAIALKKGQKFSVVVRLENPDFPYPIPAESAELKDYKTEPEYLGTGGESYISTDGKTWRDAAGKVDHHLGKTIYVSNVCLKAFTNPLPESGKAVPNVRFSLLEGPVTIGSKLELSGAKVIYYSVDGGKAKRYTKPITIKKACTVTAWTYLNGKKGNEVTRTYTKAQSLLSEVIADYGGKYTACEFSDDHTCTIVLDSSTDSIRIRPRGTDRITLNGIQIQSDSWSQEFVLDPGQEITIKLASTLKGKTSTIYKIKVCRRG